mmetsp:Transcript_16777/g.16128  ORF Transcript_16777/g.16128 Transcript_16777/m.16128 type:complete len:81 (+) Transcript_16777:123-365(+)
MENVMTSTSDDDQLMLQATIKLKIDNFKLKQKKRILTEELYRLYMEGEIEPKKRFIEGDVINKRILIINNSTNKRKKREK